MLTSQEERNEKREKREEIKTLKTQLLTIKEKLAMKTIRIDNIKDTLKRSQLLTQSKGIKEGTIPFDHDIEDVMREFENED